MGIAVLSETDLNDFPGIFPLRKVIKECVSKTALLHLDLGARGEIGSFGIATPCVCPA